MSHASSTSTSTHQQVQHLLRVDHGLAEVRHEACAGTTPYRRDLEKFKFMHDAESAPMSAVFHLFAIFVKVVEPAAVSRGARRLPGDRLPERR